MKYRPPGLLWPHLHLYWQLVPSPVCRIHQNKISVTCPVTSRLWVCRIYSRKRCIDGPIRVEVMSADLFVDLQIDGGMKLCESARLCLNRVLWCLFNHPMPTPFILALSTPWGSIDILDTSYYLDVRLEVYRQRKEPRVTITQVWEVKLIFHLGLSTHGRFPLGHCP